MLKRGRHNTQIINTKSGEFAKNCFALEKESERERAKAI